MKKLMYQFSGAALVRECGRFATITAVALAAWVAFGQTPVGTSPNPVTSSAPLSPTVGIKTTAKTETEAVEITDFAAYPPAITRPVGPFILHLINRTQNPPALQWATQVGPTALASLTSTVNLSAFVALPRQFSIVDLGAGTYTLQTNAGKVFLTITLH